MFNLSGSADTKAVDDQVAEILQLLQSGEVTLAQAQMILTALIFRAADDDEAEFRSLLTKERLRVWKEECRTKRT